MPDEVNFAVGTPGRHWGMRILVMLFVCVSCSNARHSDVATTTEVTRLQRHFVAALAEVRAHDVSHLSASQRAQRELALLRVQLYAMAGVFPHNHHAATQTPVFIDEHGTRCAVAHLIEQSGDAELAFRIANERVYAYVPELADEPELLAWLDRTGLTVEEAARIQPSYDPCINEPHGCNNDSFTFASASVVLGGFNGATIALNLQGDAGPTSASLGVLGGGLGMLLGFGKLGGESDYPGLSREEKTIALVDAGLGIAAIALGVRTFLRPRPASPPTVSVAPMLGDATGVAVSAAF